MPVLPPRPRWSRPHDTPPSVTRIPVFTALLLIGVFVGLLALAAVFGCSKNGGSVPTKPLGAICSITPAQLDFGTVAAGTAAQRTFTIHNTGTSTLEGTLSVPLGPFSLGSLPNYDVSPGESLLVIIRYAWKEGPAQVTVSTGTSCAGLPCTATGAPNPCSLSPSTLAFGHLQLGESRTLQFTLSNTGHTPFTWIPVSDTCADFSYNGRTREHSARAVRDILLHVRADPRR